MLVSFVGCPCSGKTTTAAMLFSTFKDSGSVVEFITEQARLYIAEKRLDHFRAGYEHPLQLDDIDQIKIMEKQKHVEDVFVKTSSPETLIVTDSSVINAFLYMSESRRDVNYRAVTDHLKLYDIVFYSKPVDEFLEDDLNRVHDKAFSKKINEEIPVILSKYFPEVKPISLFGTSRERYQTAMDVITNRMIS